MNNRPTPETDAIVRNAATADHPPTRLAATLTVKCEKLERERDEAREENKKLKEALIRVRTWGIFSKKFSSTDSYKMAEWIDDGCEGELPKPNGPWIYEKMEETK